MKAIPNPGTYQAKCGGQMVVYETESGALCVAVPVVLTSGEVAWQGKYTCTLGKSDGTLQQRSIETMKKVFGWDGVNPFDLEDINIDEVNFEIVGEHEAYTPAGDTEEVTVFKIKWLNPVGGSTNMPEKVEDRKSVLTKWGSKFKAVSGGKPAAKPAAKASAATPPPKAAAKPAPPGRMATGAIARTSTQEEAWAGLVKANPDESEDALGEKFYTAQDEVAEGANGELTIQQWGAVADKLGI